MAVVELHVHAYVIRHVPCVVWDRPIESHYAVAFGRGNVLELALLLHGLRLVDDVERSEALRGSLRRACVFSICVVDVASTLWVPNHSMKFSMRAPWALAAPM